MSRIFCAVLLTGCLVFPQFAQAKTTVPGDVDGDHVVSLADFECLKQMALGAKPPKRSGDLNKDGVINVLDLQTWIVHHFCGVGDIDGDGVITILDAYALQDMALGLTPPRRKGDLNLSGKIDVVDLVLWLNTFKSKAKGDLNGDGKINVVDVVTLIHQVNGQSPTTSAADINSDGKVDKKDIKALIKIVLG